MVTYSKILTIIKHEYLSKIKTKSFVISTLIAPFLLLLVIGIPAIVGYYSLDSSSKKLAIYDETNEIADILIKNDSVKYYIVDKTLEQLNSAVVSEEIDGYIKIGAEFLKNGKVDVYTRGGGGLAFISDLENDLDHILLTERLKDYEGNDAIIKIVYDDIELEKHKLTEDGNTEKDFTEAYAIIGYILGFMIYMMMFMYGMFVMRGCIEEKANRIIEILASSARPFEIMLGKILGIGALGLTQMGIWIVFGALLMFVGVPVINMFMQPDVAAMGATGMPTEVPIGFEMPSISIWLVIAFAYYFLIGYFIYATLFAAVGSAVDQEQDAQQLMIPVTIPLIIPILLLTNVMADPDGTVAVVTSLIPFFTPILMTVRVAATSVPVWQIVLSVVLTIGTFFCCVWIASKIYRVGIMMYGSKPKFKDIIKWFKAAK